MIDPIPIEFDVACSAEHAFDTWTTRIAHWWPSTHSVTGIGTPPTAPDGTERT